MENSSDITVEVGYTNLDNEDTLEKWAISEFPKKMK